MADLEKPSTQGRRIKLTPIEHCGDCEFSNHLIVKHELRCTHGDLKKHRFIEGWIYLSDIDNILIPFWCPLDDADNSKLIEINQRLKVLENHSKRPPMDTKRVLKLLKDIEFGEFGFNFCPKCMAVQARGHAPDCELAAVIAILEKLVAELEGV